MSGQKDPKAPADVSGSQEGTGTTRKPFLLRLSPRLLGELRAWAAQDFRSLNAQIEYLLAEAVKRRRGI